MPEQVEARTSVALDVATGACIVTTRTAVRAAGRSWRWSRPARGAAAWIVAPVQAYLAGDTPERLQARGAAARQRAQALAEDWVRIAVPRLLDLVLDQIDLTRLVLQRVDLDRIAAALDVDAVAARLDLDAVADRLDVERVLDRLDLTELVLRRVDLDRVAAALDVDTVAARLDLDAVADRLDVERVLDRLDLNELVLRRVDLDRVAAALDVDAIIDRLDVIALAEYIVNGIDLPRIIRESTGSVASESLRGVRTRSIEADQALAQFVDRLLLRRRSTRSKGGSDAEALERAVERATENGAAASATPGGGPRAD